MATNFAYLLNAMERAAGELNPAEHDYRAKRTAVLAHVDALEAERDRLLATPADKREDLRCVIADISAQCAALWAERDQLRAELAECKEMLRHIAVYAHDRSTSPAVHDALLEIRGMAYAALAGEGET